MHFVPVIFFVCLTYYIWQKHHVFDIALYMSGLFTLTSICSAIMVEQGFVGGSGVLSDGWNPEMGVIPTILYCTLIALTIIPFSILRPEKIKKITNSNRYILLVMSIIIIIQGLLMYYLVGSSISDIMNGDFKDLKNAGYMGDATPADIKMLAMPLPARILFFTSYLTTFGLPLFFYYSCVEKRSLWLTTPLLAASISPILRGIMSADRTEIIYYGLMFIFCLLFFRNFISRKIKWFLAIISVPVFFAAMVYVVAVSASRFEDNDEGAGGSMLEYAGQSYVNFCYFYDHHNSSLYYVERELPITMYVLTKTQYTDTKDERTAKEGFWMGVFASFVGSWLLDIGTVGATVLCILFALFCIMVINRFNRDEYDASDVLLLFILASVPIFGIFYYRFYNPNIAIQTVIAVALYLYSKIRFIWTEAKDKETK